MSAFEIRRPGSVIANVQATLLNHPDAKCIFVEKLNRLNIGDLIPGAQLQQKMCQGQSHSVDLS